jgi:hypothetical protein
MERDQSFWITSSEHQGTMPKRILSFSCSMQVISFHIKILLYQHGQSALNTSRTLFLLASTQGVSCRLVMNHLIYVYVLSHIYVSKCMYVYVHISLFLPELYFGRHITHLSTVRDIAWYFGRRITHLSSQRIAWYFGRCITHLSTVRDIAWYFGRRITYQSIMLFSYY